MPLIARKNPLAFEVLYERYQTQLFGYLLRQLFYDHAKANDILHDVFLKVIENAHRFDPEFRFKSWVYSIAYNCCKNEFRKNEHIKAHKLYISNKQEPWEEQNPDNALFQEQYAKASEKMSYEHRAVFELRHKEGFSLKEIAEVMECNLGTVKSRLHHATHFLANELQVFNPNKINYGSKK